MKILLLGVAVTAFAAPVFADNACPPRQGRLIYPWVQPDPMPGDDYAEVYLDLDSTGKATACRIGRNNIPGDNKFFVCRAFLGGGFKTTPPANGQKTIRRDYVGYGVDHVRAERKARKKFFAEHPSERPECYPEDVGD